MFKHVRLRRALARGALMASLCVASYASAQTHWPSKPITIIAPSAPASPIDTLARAVSGGLARELNTSVVVDNKPGASGKLGIVALLNAPRDGHTIAVTTLTHLASVPVFNPKPGYRVPEDFALLTLAVQTPAVLVVHPSVPARTLAEFVRYAKANPGKLNYASFGERSSSHLASEDLWDKMGVSVAHVPFKSEAEGINALISGQVQVMSTSGAAAPQIEAGRLVGLATSGAARWDVLPKLPTFMESGLPEFKDYVYTPWLGFSAAAGTPPDVTAKLSAALRAVLRQPEAQRMLGNIGYTVVALSPEDMAAAVTRDQAVYRRLLKANRVRVEAP